VPQIKFLPDGREVSVRPGTTLLAAGRQAGVSIRTRCNGVMGCLMCKVKVLHPEAVSTMSEAERRKIGDEPGQQLRLACQAKTLSDAVVELPEDPLKAAVRRQLERQKEDEGLW
jgi:2Fe-2S ferredoxin